MITPTVLADILHTLERTPNACITVDKSLYRANGTILISRGGKSWLLHRYLAHRLGLPMSAFMLPGGCRTFGCMNPRHRILSTTPSHGKRTVCPNGHPYTPANTLSTGPRRCRQCRDDRNVRRRQSTRRRGYCIRDHKLTDANVYLWKDAQGRMHRRCRRCHLERMQARRAKTPIDTT